MDSIERFQSLIELGENCKSRLYFLKSLLDAVANGQRDESLPECLVNPDLVKIRQKILKSFPSLPDLTKIQGYDIIVAQAKIISSKLNSFRQLLNEIVFFSESSKELLISISSSVLDFQMDKNRNISILFFELLTCHMKLMWIFSSIEDIKVMYGFSEIATEIVSRSSESNNIQKTTKATLAREVKIISDLDNIHVAFVNSFWCLSILMRPLLLQFKESLEYSENYISLRDNSVLNSVREGPEALTKYATGYISKESHLFKYIELRDVEKYREYVIFGCFACPSIIADNDILNLLKLVCQGTLFIGLCRDMVFNVHVELEVLSLVFPLQDNSAIIQSASSSTKLSPTVVANVNSATTFPPGFKAKKIFKELSRMAVSTAGTRMRERRSFILGEIQSLYYTLDTLPGLIGPRLPQIIAAASFAKVEILNYFRTAQFISWKTIRKDAKKYIDLTDFMADDVILLMSELRSLITLVTQYQDIIFNYYSEYLLDVDFKCLKTLLDNCSEISDIYKSQFDIILSNMDSLRAFCNSKSSKNSVSDTSLPSFKELRSNWDKIIFMIYSINVGAVSRNLKTFQDLCFRMQGVYERSKYIDELSTLISESMDPYDIWWFREKLTQTFTACLNSSSQRSVKLSAIMKSLSSVKYCFNDKNIGESDRIKLSIEFYMDDRLNDIGVHVVSLLKAYWTSLQSLENQVTTIEAARRIEKLLMLKAAKKNDADRIDARSSIGSDVADPIPSANQNLGASSGIDALPGAESEVWAKQSIEKLVDIHQRLVNAMTMAKDVGLIRIFDREYDVCVFLRQRIVAFIEDQLVNLFDLTASADTASNPSIYSINGPKHLYIRFKTLCYATQIAYGSIGSHVSTPLRLMLFKECCDLSIPPPGVPPVQSSSSAGQLLGDSLPATTVEFWGNLLWKVVDWFSKLSQQILSDTSSSETLVWVPYLASIVRPIAKAAVVRRGSLSAFLNSQSGSMLNLESISLEYFLSRQELTYLVRIIGVQGIRILDQEIINSIAEKIALVKDLLVKNQQDFQEAFEDISKAFEVYIKLQPKISAAFDALKGIGLLLAIREILHASLGDVIRDYSPGLNGLTKSAAAMLNFHGSRKATSPFHYLSFDAGNSSSIDLALAQALAPHLSRASDRPSLSLLPVLGSLFYLDDSWKKSQYLPHYDCFANNEHAVTFALSKLFICVFGKETITELQASLIISPTMKAKVNVKSQPTSKAEELWTTLPSPRMLISLLSQSPSSLASRIAIYDLKVHCQVYLVMSTELLYMLKSNSFFNRRDSYPVQHMFTVLEQFTRWCPMVSISDLNEFLPTSMTHISRTEVSSSNEINRMNIKRSSVISQAEVY